MIYVLCCKSLNDGRLGYEEIKAPCIRETYITHNYKPFKAPSSYELQRQIVIGSSRKSLYMTESRVYCGYPSIVNSSEDKSTAIVKGS